MTDHVSLKVEQALVHEPGELTGKVLLTRTNTETPTPSHFKFKLLKNKNKEETLKAAREESVLISKGKSIQWMLTSQSELRVARRQWHDIWKMLEDIRNKTV